MSESAELPAIESGAQTVTGSAPPHRFVDRPGGTGGDMGVRLDGVSALNGAATAWPFRDEDGGGSMGSAAWWGRPPSRLTPTSLGGGGGAGSIGMPGSGYSVSGGAKAKGPGTPAPPAAAKAATSGSSGGGSTGGGSSSGGSSGGGSSSESSGGSSSSDPLFDEHSSSLDDLAGDVVEDAGDLAGGLAGDPGFIGGAGDLSPNPEPASLLLMATGLAGVIEASRRRRQRQQQR